MKAIVLHESLYGNTAAIAREIGEGLKEVGSVAVTTFDEATEATTDDAELVVVGGPTHGWSMTRPESRQAKGTEGYRSGVREWLGDVRTEASTRYAAFDTRFDKPRWLTGSAAVRIAKRLKDAGAVVLVPPESFFVQGTKGPLKEGELERARRWGAGLASRLAEETLSRR